MSSWVLYRSLITVNGMSAFNTCILIPSNVMPGYFGFQSFVDSSVPTSVIKDVL